MPQNSNKITAQHLQRKAIVYLRQSSERQVQRNTESQRLQYKLEDRARELGFKQVEIIDTDLGCSAAIGAARREGFERLVASVAIGEVGLILSREVSRLSRTDKDWCQLLEVCQLFGTLIGDAEHVYDLSLMDDQLVLGIKGTLSVVELKVLNLRLQQGMEEKARRGELARLLPPGYVRDGTGKVTKDPDRRVQEAIDLVFGIFRKTRSIRQTFVWFKTRQVELPVNKSQGAGIKLIWQVPSHAFVSSVLHNPFYAGAYVYGRRATETAVVGGRVVWMMTSVPGDCDGQSSVGYLFLRIMKGILTGRRSRKTLASCVTTRRKLRAMKQSVRCALARVFLPGCCVVAAVVGSCTCATGARAVPRHAIAARGTSIRAGSTVWLSAGRGLTGVSPRSF